MAWPVLFTREDQMAIQRLYLVQAMQPHQIADKLFFKAKQVQSLITRKGWAKMRKEHDQRINKLAASKMSVIEGDHEAFVESVRIQSQELVEKGLKRARSASDGKDFSGYASGVKAFYDTYERVTGLANDAKQGAVSTLNLIFVTPPVVEDTKLVQETAIDI